MWQLPSGCRDPKEEEQRKGCLGGFPGEEGSRGASGEQDLEGQEETEGEAGGQLGKQQGSKAYAQGVFPEL